MTDTYPPDGKYRLEADVNPDADGIYTVRVHHGDEHLTTYCKYDRNDALRKAEDYVAWHRDHEPTVEVFEL